MATLKVGLIGCGQIAQLVHLNVLTHLPDVELVAIAEPDEQRRREGKRRTPSAVAFTSYMDLLEQSTAEAVVVCVPTPLHAEVGIAALEQGKHVYLEKPLATSLEEGQQVLAAANYAHRTAMVGFNYRFNALYQNARRHLRSGRLGELVGVRSTFTTPARTLPIWKQRRDGGGGVLLDLASHHIDLVHYLFGRDVREVFARVWSQHTEDDSAMVELSLDGGLTAQGFFSLGALDEDTFEIYGDAGKLRVDRYLSLDAELSEPNSQHRRGARVWRSVRRWAGPYAMQRILAPGNEPSYRAALARFAQAARWNQPVTPDLLDGYRSLLVVDAAERSARAGLPVRVGEINTPTVPVGASHSNGVPA